MFLNKEGWLVVAPYENNGDEISQTGYSKEEIVGIINLLTMELTLQVL